MHELGSVSRMVAFVAAIVAGAVTFYFIGWWLMISRTCVPGDDWSVSAALEDDGCSQTRRGHADMNADLKAKWIAALRSGKYKQGHLRLRHGDAFDCLAVLADIAGAEWLHVSGDNYWALLPNARIAESHYLPSNFLALDVQRRFARENDVGTTFTEIADIIERELMV